jgi:hypothetical protein
MMPFTFAQAFFLTHHDINPRIVVYVVVTCLLSSVDGISDREK